jgi:hypothetical protein
VKLKNFILLCCFQFGAAFLFAQNAQQKLLEGKWHVVASNFPMWLDGKNLNPTFNYTNFKTNNELLKFDDLVLYSKNGKEKKIKGRDKQKEKGKLKFQWRGKGLLGLFVSRWQVVANDAEGQWIAVYATATLVSPESLDILSRNKKMPEHQLKDIISHIKAEYTKKPIQVLK